MLATTNLETLLLALTAAAWGTEPKMERSRRTPESGA
jgi:hypothetical protein